MITLLKDILSNKTRIIAVISLVILISKSYGLDLTQYIGADWNTTLTNIFALITLIAIGDNGGVKNETIQDTSQNENISTVAQSEDTTQTEDTTQVTQNQNDKLTATLSDTKLEQIKQILNQ